MSGEAFGPNISHVIRLTVANDLRLYTMRMGVWDGCNYVDLLPEYLDIASSELGAVRYWFLAKVDAVDHSYPTFSPHVSPTLMGDSGPGWEFEHSEYFVPEEGNGVGGGIGWLTGDGRYDIGWGPGVNSMSTGFWCIVGPSGLTDTPPSALTLSRMAPGGVGTGYWTYDGVMHVVVPAGQVGLVGWMYDAPCPVMVTPTITPASLVYVGAELLPLSDGTGGPQAGTLGPGKYTIDAAGLLGCWCIVCTPGDTTYAIQPE